MGGAGSAPAGSAGLPAPPVGHPPPQRMHTGEWGAGQGQVALRIFRLFAANQFGRLAPQNSIFNPCVLLSFWESECISSRLHCYFKIICENFK